MSGRTDPVASGRYVKCSRCRQTIPWPLGSIKYDLWLARHDCRLLRLIERPGQPGKNTDDRAGLVGRGMSRSSVSPLASDDLEARDD